MQERNGKTGLVGTNESSIEAVPKVKLKRKMTRSVSCKRLHWPNESNLSERLTIRCAKDETIELEIVLDQARESRRTDDADIEGVTIGMRSRMRINPEVSRVIEMKRKKRKKIDAIANSGCVIVRLSKDFQMFKCERSSSQESPVHWNAGRYQGSDGDQLISTESVLEHMCRDIGLSATRKSGEAVSNGICMEIADAISMNETRNEGWTKSDVSGISKRCKSDEPMRTTEESAFERKKMNTVLNTGDANDESLSFAECVSSIKGIGTDCKSGTKATDGDLRSGNKATNAGSASDSRSCKIGNESSREVKVVLTIDVPQIKETESFGAESVRESELSENRNKFRNKSYQLYELRPENRNKLSNNRNELYDDRNEFRNELAGNDAECIHGVWNISDPEVRDCIDVMDESIISTAESGVNVLAGSIGSVAMSNKNVLAESVSGTALCSMNVLAESISGTAIGGMKVKAVVKNSSAKSCAKFVNGRDAMQSSAKCMTKSLGGVVETIGASSVKSVKSRRSGKWNCKNACLEFLLGVLGKEMTAVSLWVRSLRHGRVSEVPHIYAVLMQVCTKKCTWGTYVRRYVRSNVRGNVRRDVCRQMAGAWCMVLSP